MAAKGGTGGAGGASGTANASAGAGTGAVGIEAGQGGQDSGGVGGTGTAGTAGTSGSAGLTGSAGGPMGGVVHAGDETACDHSFGNPDCWSIFDVSALHSSGTFFGGAFDGRYVYFVATGTTEATLLLRYDTQASFLDETSFTVFNLSTVNEKTHKFMGAGFDGRFLYLVPFDWNFSGTASRFDTEGELDAGTSWSSLDLTQMDEMYPPIGYVGAVFDGRHLYYVPNCVFGYLRGLTLRLDTEGSFDSLDDWSSFDTRDLDPNAAGYRGGTFDGRYVYFTPWGDLSSGALTPQPITARYDTQADFDDMASWSLFDMSVLNNTPTYAGAVFDGTYVYYPAGDARGRLTRFDTGEDFESADSWEVFEMSTAVEGVNDYFDGGVFDGRYVYLVPESSTVVRYDTTAAFDSKPAYEALNLTPLDALAGNFAGGVFDGRYVYYVPVATNHVVRFDARADHALPASSGASFY